MIRLLINYFKKMTYFECEKDVELLLQKNMDIDIAEEMVVADFESGKYPNFSLQICGYF